MSTRQQKIERLANNLSDELFAADEAVKAICEEESIAAQRALEAQKAVPNVDRSAVRELIARLQAEMSGAQTRKVRAAVDDLIAGDHEFPRAARAVENIERVKRQLDAAQTAFSVLDQCLSEMGEPVNEASRVLNGVRSKKAELLRRLKLEHAEGVISGRIPNPKHA